MFYKNKILTFVFIFLFFNSSSNISNANITIPITNLPSETSEIILTREELWEIFSLNFPFWKNGQKIVIVMYEIDNPIQKTFLREYFGINPYRYQELIDGKINSGRITPPIIVLNEKQMINEIKNKTGRIGFVRSYVLIGEKHGIQKIKVVDN